MYNTGELYELSFVAPNEGAKPRLVFTIATVYLEELVERLRILSTKWHSHAQNYCHRDVEFVLFSSDLFGRVEFGYDRCGFVTTSNEETLLELDREKLQASTMTLKLLTLALAVPIKKQRASNRLQQIDLELRCDPFDINGYNHAVSGYVSAPMIAWLRKQGMADSMRLPKPILDSMRQTWKAVCRDGLQHWAAECDAWVDSDGRFMLCCFGNACDIAIYPDGSCGKMDDAYVRFSCHNLDSAVQQVTLLAGLAKMCELARIQEEL
ncbi:MAG: hypothetical protein P4L81_05305 [Candidatus Pacebacteria bacterium]|nr:hypothetical protein [Candidatus Paceibacterota bacterium]